VTPQRQISCLGLEKLSAWHRAAENGRFKWTIGRSHIFRQIASEKYGEGGVRPSEKHGPP